MMASEVPNEVMVTMVVTVVSFVVSLDVELNETTPNDGRLVLLPWCETSPLRSIKKKRM